MKKIWDFCLTACIGLTAMIWCGGLLFLTLLYWQHILMAALYLCAGGLLLIMLWFMGIFVRAAVDDIRGSNKT